MQGSQTLIERAFSLAATGRMNSVADIRTALRVEGYPDEGHLRARTLSRQLMKLIAEAKHKSDSA
jgi:hypothetical protein